MSSKIHLESKTEQHRFLKYPEVVTQREARILKLMFKHINKRPKSNLWYSTIGANKLATLLQVELSSTPIVPTPPNHPTKLLTIKPTILLHYKLFKVEYCQVLYQRIGVFSNQKFCANVLQLCLCSRYLRINVMPDSDRSRNER